MKSFLAYWKTLSWSLLMLAVFLIPGDNLSKAPSIPFLPEVAHISFFALFTWLLIRDLAKTRYKVRPTGKIYITVLLISVLFGVLIEVLQSLNFIARTREITDVLLDFSGSLLSVVLAALYYRFRQSEEPIE
jgi:VanZ family protein